MLSPFLSRRCFYSFINLSCDVSEDGQTVCWLHRWTFLLLSCCCSWTRQHIRWISISICPFQIAHFILSSYMYVSWWSTSTQQQTRTFGEKLWENIPFYKTMFPLFTCLLTHTCICTDTHITLGRCVKVSMLNSCHLW